MNITLTDKNGIVLEEWFTPDEDQPLGTTPMKVRSKINGLDGVYWSESDYNDIVEEFKAEEKT